VREGGGERWRWWAAWAESGEAGGVWMGRRRGKKRKGKKKRRKVGWAAGREMGWFFFLFQSFLNLFQTLLNSKLLHLFKFKFLTQISPTILKAFHKPFLTTFQTYFKFKPLHKFSQAISQLFLGTLSQIF
jgi:hypothetical protein